MFFSSSILAVQLRPTHFYIKTILLTTSTSIVKNHLLLLVFICYHL